MQQQKAELVGTSTMPKGQRVRAFESGQGKKAYLEFLVHESAACKVWLHEMHHAQAGAGGDVHDLLLVLDLHVRAVV